MSTENEASAHKHFWIRFESYYKREQTFKKSIIYKKKQNTKSPICISGETKKL